MNISKMRSEIINHIDTGVYLYFPQLRERLEYISGKLAKMKDCKNTFLTKGEKKTLKENEYLR